MANFQLRFQLKLQTWIFILILVGSAVATIAGRDRWYPFSNYPMYASVFPPKPYVFHYLRLVQSNGEETPLQVRPFLWPYWHVAFSEAVLAPDDDVVIERKMRATLEWYNRELLEKTRGELKPAIALKLYRDESPWSEEIARANSSRLLMDQMDHPGAKLRLEVKP